MVSIVSILFEWFELPRNGYDVSEYSFNVHTKPTRGGRGLAQQKNTTEY